MTTKSLLSRPLMPVRIALAASFAAFLAAGAAHAHSYKTGVLSIGHLWAKPTANAAGPAEVFGPILNRGQEEVRLVRVGAQSAGKAGVCTSEDGETVWRDEAVIEARSVLAFAAWREHICLADLAAPLQAGDSVALTLEFSDGASVDVDVVIETSAGH